MMRSTLRPHRMVSQRRTLLPRMPRSASGAPRLPLRTMTRWPRRTRNRRRHRRQAASRPRQLLRRGLTAPRGRHLRVMTRPRSTRTSPMLQSRPRRRRMTTDRPKPKPLLQSLSGARRKARAPRRKPRCPTRPHHWPGMTRPSLSGLPCRMMRLAVRLLAVQHLPALRLPGPQQPGRRLQGKPDVMFRHRWRCPKKRLRNPAPACSARSWAV